MLQVFDDMEKCNDGNRLKNEHFTAMMIWRMLDIKVEEEGQTIDFYQV